MTDDRNIQAEADAHVIDTMRCKALGFESVGQLIDAYSAEIFDRPHTQSVADYIASHKED